MKTKRNRSDTGFTIVEVLIVLAVSGLIFVSVALVISGKQQTAEFQTAIQDVKAGLQQVINETASGYYPNPGNFTCLSTSGTPHFQAGNTSQGANYGCEFLGKVIHFSKDSNNYEVYPVAGKQDSTGNLDAANPVLIAGTPESQGFDASTSVPLEYGLNVVSMYYNDAGSNKKPIGSLAFIQSLGSPASASADAEIATQPFSGSQQLDLVVPTGGSSSIIATALNEVGYVHTDFNTPGKYNDSSVENNTNAEICFQSGTTQQSALITIGSGTTDSNGGLSIQLQIYNDESCGADS